MDMKEPVYEVIDRIYLVPDIFQQWAYVNMAVNEISGSYGSKCEDY
jgi:hypothetical protein